MAIPSTPTWTATISAAMITAGRYNVSYTEVQNMAARGAQDVKTELWAASRYDILLSTETVVLVTTGTSAFTVPPDFDHEQTLVAYYSGDGTRDRAQAGNNQAITIASNDTAADAAYNGYSIFLLAGTGSGQSNQITYNTSSTKVLSLTHAWSTNPDSTTDYLIGQFSRELTRAGDRVPPTVTGIPTVYRITGYTLTIGPPPDHIYPIVMTYSPNLTMIDETSTPFVKWLKERMALIKQGIRVQTMLWLDDDRYDRELVRWELMKQRYGAQNPTYSQAERHR